MFRFAVMGAAQIAVKFCDAVTYVDDAEVTAVSSRSLERAQAFAKANGLARAYGSYEEMLVQEKPDCVYVATTMESHYDMCMLALKHNIPILCEKSMTVSVAQAEEIFALAAEKKLFIMEAMWSRFLPAVRKAKEWLDAGLIGKPVFGDMSIGFYSERNDNNRFWNPKLGGGVCYDLTVYSYDLTTYMLGNDIEDIQIHAVKAPTGVDAQDHLSLFYKNGVLASLWSTLLNRPDERLCIHGEHGRIIVPNSHYADKAYLYVEGQETVEFIDSETHNGFEHEVREAIRCIKAGLLESETVPHSLTIETQKLFERIQKEMK